MQPENQRPNPAGTKAAEGTLQMVGNPPPPPAFGPRRALLRDGDPATPQNAPLRWSRALNLHPRSSLALRRH